MAKAGKRIINYLETLNQQLHAENAEMLHETMGLKRNVEQINKIVAMQQAHGKVMGVAEIVNVSELVEAALHVNLTRIFSHGFTTQENGHGFSLHGGALAAKELGGTLTAAGDGPGKGSHVCPRIASGGEISRRRFAGRQRPVITSTLRRAVNPSAEFRAAERWWWPVCGR